MPENTMQTQKPLQTLMQIINGVSGIIAILAVVFFGGALWAQVYKNHEPRINALEQKGSAALQVHEGKDDQRVGDLQVQAKDNKANIESLTRTTADNLTEIKMDIREIRARLDMLANKAKP